MKKSKKSRKHIGFALIAILVILAVAAIVVLTAKPQAVPQNSGVIAQVNGKPITQAQIDSLYKRLAPEFQTDAARASLLNQTIDEMLLLDEAQRQGFTITTSQVNDQYQLALSRQNLTDAQVQESLGRFNLTVNDIKNELQKQLIIFELINRTIINETQVTDEEIFQFYVARGGTNDNNLTLTSDTKRQIKSIILDQKITDGVSILLKRLRAQATIVINNQK